MKLSDTLLTSTQNLYSRKWRTALNLLGVVVACTMLIMTFAGTRGVADGIDRMISALDGVSRFVIRPSWESTKEPPLESYQVIGDMSDARRERMQERLKQDWLSEFGDVEKLTQEIVDELAGIEGIVELVPSLNLRCELQLLESDSPLPKWRQANAAAVSVLDSSIERDIVTGSRLASEDTYATMVDELFAYQLGFSSDEQLEELIGKKLVMRFENTGLRDESFYFLRALGENAGADMAEKVQLLKALQTLVGDLDNTKLSSKQKEQIRKAFGEFASVPQKSDPGEQSAGMQKNKTAVSRVITKELVIKGVVREAKRDGIENLLNLARGHSTSAILIHPALAREIRVDLKRKNVGRAIGTVASIDQLETVVDEIESRGYQVSSVAHTIGRITKHINRILVGISILAGIILLVAALMISNTLTISVIERTPEFGVMKAIGARDRDVLSMMLCEGAMTGIVGAALATLISFGLASFIGYFVREYVEGQIGDVFTAEIFRFSAFDILVTLGIGCAVCTLASVLPALRAARLDPIVAMRRK